MQPSVCQDAVDVEHKEPDSARAIVQRVHLT
jgi:hypothetical protein